MIMQPCSQHESFSSKSSKPELFTCADGRGAFLQQERNACDMDAHLKKREGPFRSRNTIYAETKTDKHTAQGSAIQPDM